MRKMLTLALVGSLLGNGLAGCGGDSTSSDSVTTACERISDAACAKLVECKGMAGGVLLTNALCDQAHQKTVDDCKQKQGAALSKGTSTEIDACVQGYANFQCSNLCNQVAKTPDACVKFDPEPGTETITCAP